MKKCERCTYTGLGVKKKKKTQKTGQLKAPGVRTRPIILRVNVNMYYAAVVLM